jgi:hypothetical protein
LWTLFVLQSSVFRTGHTLFFQARTRLDTCTAMSGGDNSNNNDDNETDGGKKDYLLQVGGSDGGGLESDVSDETKKNESQNKSLKLALDQRNFDDNIQNTPDQDQHLVSAITPTNNSNDDSNNNSNSHSPSGQVVVDEESAIDAYVVPPSPPTHGTNTLIVPEEDVEKYEDTKPSKTKVALVISGILVVAVVIALSLTFTVGRRNNQSSSSNNTTMVDDVPTMAPSLTMSPSATPTVFETTAM